MCGWGSPPPHPPAPPAPTALWYWMCCSLNRRLLLINLELLNREISQWDGNRRKVLMAWWPRWQLVKKREEDWLVNMPYCFIVVRTPPPSRRSPPRRLPLLFSFICSTSASSLLYYSNFSIMSPTLPYSSPPPLQPNALFSLNALFLLTSCLHPSQWPCITPGRIIALGLSISSVAPYSALSALSIYGVSPFAASHLPTVQ